MLVHSKSSMGNKPTCHLRRTALIVVMLFVFGGAFAQQVRSLTASANGKGTLKVGKEVFNVHAVVVKLLEGGNAEINLVSDITVFLNGSWAATNDQSVINVDITGGATGGGLQGSGKVFLRQDGKSIARLTLDATSKTTKRNIEVRFESQ
jgi:hypothetical protein